MMRMGLRAALAAVLAAGVTVCLSTGVALAHKTEARGAHSCCAGGDSGGVPDQAKTSSGMPKCCLFMAQHKIAHLVLTKVGLHDCGAAPASASPVLQSVRAVVSAPGFYLQFLTQAVLSIRAPPQA